MSSLRASLLVLPALLGAGCSPVLWGNIGVLGVTVGIFLGTVFLSRTSASTSARAATSTASSGTPS